MSCRFSHICRLSPGPSRRAARATWRPEIAKQEGRLSDTYGFLAPLAFTSPKIIAAIANGSMPDVKVTELAKGGGSALLDRSGAGIELRSG
jgi:hypothetical protein